MGETEYCLKLLPFGGACIMLGQDFLDAEEDDEDNQDENEKEKNYRCL